MMTRYLLVAIVTLSLFLPTVAFADFKAVEDLVTEALENNPELAAAKSRWEQSTFSAAQVSSLDDPMLSFALSNYPSDSFRSDETPMTGNELRLAQKFPFPGKLGAKEQVAKEQEAWFKAVYDDARYQVARKVKDAWLRLYFQARAIDVVERNLELIDQVIQLTETRYEVGTGLQQDVLKAQVERSRMSDRLIQLRQQQTATLADLNTQLGRPTATDLDVPEELDTVTVESSVEMLQEAAEQQRPVYNAYRSLVDRYRAEQNVADLNYKPDVTLWAGYRFRDDDLPDGGTDFVSAGFSVNLPIYRAKRDAAVAQAQAGVRTAQRQFDQFRQKVHFNIHDAYSLMEQNEEQARLYREGIVPQSVQAFNAAMTAYQVGKVEFMTLLDALMKLYNYEVDAYRFQTDYLRSVARLESEAGVTLIGAPLPGVVEE